MTNAEWCPTEEVAIELARIPCAPESDSPSELAEWAALVRVADRKIAEQVLITRADLGWSWAQVGQQLGVTAQAAQQRFGKLPAVPSDDTVHARDCRGEVHLRRDRTAWGCPCGAAGSLD